MKRIYSEQKTEVKEYIFSKTVYETKSIMDTILTHAIDVSCMCECARFPCNRKV